MGLDVGNRRVGVALSDQSELIARPLVVLIRRSNDVVFQEIANLVVANDVGTIVAGLPIASDESLGEQGRLTLAFIRQLRRRVAVPIVTWDERESSREAARRLAAGGSSTKRRLAPIDALAAAVILEEWLDGRHATRSQASSADVDARPLNGL
jgi:putative pre-16S rRNA nuclease